MGDTLWTRTYGGALTDAGLSVDQTSDEGYIISGTRESVTVRQTPLKRFISGVTSGDLLEENTNISNATDLWLIKTDSKGDTLWTRIFGGPLADYGFSVVQTDDDGYIIGGGTRSFGEGGRDGWMIKTDAQGLIGTDVDLQLSADSLFFEYTLIGYQSSETLMIYNTGSDELSVTSLPVTGEFSIQPQIPPALVMAGGDSLAITITFSPSVTGVSEGTVTIHSNDPDTPEQTVSLTGTGYEPLTITTVFFPDGIAGEPYSEILNPDGGIPPYSWAVSGTLPPGFILNISDGTISGISTPAGSYPFTVVLSDSRVQGVSTRQELTITILPGQLTQVEVIPDLVTLEPNQSQQFAASGSDVHGNPVDVDPLWEASGGIIDQNGLYTAGSEGGHFSVTATDPASSVQGHAAVEIVLTVMKGDVNCDGNITPGDALCAFWRSILGSFQDECQCDESEQAADVNCDGTITPGDALCIFWFSITGVWSEECQCQE